MNISKKQLTLLLGVILLLVVSNVAVALYYMSRSVDFSGGVEVFGSITVYDEDGVTELTSHAFPNFTGGTAGTYFKIFFINNTGDQPVNVYWNISSSTLSWLATSSGYTIPSTFTYFFDIQTSWTPSPTETWSPNDYTTPEALAIPVGEGIKLRVFHQYIGNTATAETYSFTTTFYAESV